MEVWRNYRDDNHAIFVECVLKQLECFFERRTLFVSRDAMTILSSSGKGP